MAEKARGRRSRRAAWFALTLTTLLFVIQAFVSVEAWWPADANLRSIHKFELCYGSIAIEWNQRNWGESAPAEKQLNATFGLPETWQEALDWPRVQFSIWPRWTGREA